MFFNGTLQEGIASSLQQNKSVVCFVTDDGEESQLWESDFLVDSSLQSSLRNQAVLLRLTAGSEEAGYLAAIFPLPKTPTLVIIKNGDLKGYITAGTTKEDFLTKVSSAFSAVFQTSTAAQPAVPASAPAPVPQASRTSRTTQSGAQSSDSSSGPPSSGQEEGSSANVRDVLAERAARLEAQRRESERKAKEARAAKVTAAANDTSAEAVETRKYSEKLRKQRQEAADERARILRRIEDDKLERQARTATSAPAKQQAKLGDVATSLASVESSPMRPRSGQAAVQIRLFDGSSLRTRFESGKATLKGHVRQWVDESRTDGTEPYTFKVMLPPPHPSRRVDETEEGKTLAELGLAPSATLMLAPVHNFAEAYASPRNGLLVMLLSAFGFVAGIFAWLWGLVTGVFSGQGGRDGREGTSEDRDRGEAEAQAARVREQRAGRFTQFANPDDRRKDQQLYNGNSLNFEPRPDDEDES